MPQTVLFKGSRVNLTGNILNVSDLAPTVELTDGNLSPVTLGGAQGSVQILLTLPSLDTAVCATEARAFNVRCAALESVQTTIISMDLPFASKRFCSTEGIERLKTASDFRDKAFGRAYGVLISSGTLTGLLARAVFVIGKDGRIVYKEIVSEISAEPDYDQPFAAAKAAAETPLESKDL